jgi:hypothetical protein
MMISALMMIIFARRHCVHHLFSWPKAGMLLRTCELDELDVDGDSQETIRRLWRHHRLSNLIKHKIRT